MRFDAIVLAGGSSRRLGGTDKAEVRLGGVRLLDRALEAVGEARRIVVVGPRRPAPARVRWTRESPPGGGPAAALKAGLELVSAPAVVVLAVDAPFVDAAVVRRLVTAVGEEDGAVLVDAGGVPQYLVGAYRRNRIEAAVAAVDSVAGMPVGALLGGLRVGRIADELAAQDVDSWDEVDAARKRLGDEGRE
jgi:molybdopterin-guanine dinucleotide biosynthesis protein A